MFAEYIIIQYTATDKEASSLINRYIITCHTEPIYYQQQSIFYRLLPVSLDDHKRQLQLFLMSLRKY